MPTVAGFEWDDGNRMHCRKHGMEPEEIETVFRGLPRIVPDLKHADAEARFLAVGRTEKGRAALSSSRCAAIASGP